MNAPVHASYEVSGVSRRQVFTALLDFQGFPEWGCGLRDARLLDGAAELRTGAAMELVLSAGGLVHRIVSTIEEVEDLRKIEWRYTAGAVGTGGWLLEDAGPDTLRMTLFTDYQVDPAWLNRLAHRPFFRNLTEDLLRRSMRRFVERLQAE